jgi:hypothetical protein
VLLLLLLLCQAQAAAVLLLVCGSWYLGSCQSSASSGTRRL